MFRLASDFAFPGIVSKWRFSPQLFRAQSTSEKAWVAPYRHELLDIYTHINQAIASLVFLIFISHSHINPLSPAATRKHLQSSPPMNTKPTLSTS